MVDLESMGTGYNAAIISVGVAHFDGSNILDTYYSNVHLQSCINAGLTVTPATVKWWAQQSEDARAAWDDPHAPLLIDMLKTLQDWMLSKGPASSIVPWGNGADFDLVILRSAFEAVDADPPWKYYNHRCFRTLKNLYPKVEVAREGTHHHALDDAVHQARVLQTLYAQYGFALV